MNLDMQKPCANCPFKKVGAIDLHPGRVDDICQGQIADDTRPFLCHKTVYGPNGSRKKASICAGSMVYLMKVGRPNVAMRMGFALGLLDAEKLKAQVDTVIDPTPEHMTGRGRVIRKKEVSSKRLTL